MTEQFRITAGLDLGAIEATVYGDTWVELKVSDDDGDHVQYIEVHDARALRVWLDLVIPPDSVDETNAELAAVLPRMRSECADLGGKYGITTAGCQDWSYSACQAFALACHRLSLKQSAQETSEELNCTICGKPLDDHGGMGLPCPLSAPPVNGSVPQT